MDTICLISQLAAHISIFISIMLHYNRLTQLENRRLSFVAALVAGTSLSAAIRIALTWPEPIGLIDYAQSVVVVAIAWHVVRCGGRMGHILSLKPRS